MAEAKSIERFRLAAREYYDNERFTDLTIVCDGKEQKVHRCFVCPHSKWFERCCSGTFEESTTNRVELKEDFPEVIEKMITYFYTFDYDDKVVTDPLPQLRSERPTNELQMNAWVYAIAEKYEAMNLKELALEKFKRSAKVTDVDLMLGAAWTIYKDIPLPQNDRILHETITDMWLMGGKDLAADVGDETMESYLVMLPEFMTKVYMRLVRGLDGGVKQYCLQCGRYEVFVASEVSELSTKGFFCKSCKKSIAVRDTATLSGTVMVKKYW